MQQTILNEFSLRRYVLMHYLKKHYLDLLKDEYQEKVATKNGIRRSGVTRGYLHEIGAFTWLIMNELRSVKLNQFMVQS